MNLELLFDAKDVINLKKIINPNLEEKPDMGENKNSLQTRETSKKNDEKPGITTSK